MAIPKFEDLFNNVLEILLDEKAHKTSEIKDIVTDSLNLRNFELKQATSAGEPTIRNRIGWTISTLKKAGYVESQKRGYVNITDVGLREYKENITCL